MLLSEVMTTLGAKRILGLEDYDCEVGAACGSDLMSDVLRFIKPGALLLTGLTAPQVVYAAEVADIGIICFVRGKTPLEDTLRLAEARGLVLLATHLPMFESCGRLYKAGLKGCSENQVAEALDSRRGTAGSRVG
ncbi:MAG: hypothetical protein ABSA52_02220 [Candidatus Binatia bacterium]|jgi:hypothetical protein